MPSTIGQSPPPISPRKTEASTPKRKSKHTSRPAPLARRHTPQSITKLGAPKHQRESDPRISMDDAESFPDYCTFCEKQIAGNGNPVLYCSESCRQRDLQATLPSPHNTTFTQNSSHLSPSYKPSSQHIPFSSNSRAPASPPQSPFQRPYSFGLQDGPDIIPRASPTISRPRSYFSSDPFTLPTPSTSAETYAVGSLPAYHKTAPERQGSSTALASLRELSSALSLSRDTSARDRERERAYRSSRSSRDSRSSLSSMEDHTSGSPTITKTNSGVWSYMTSRASRKSSKDKELSKTYDAPSAFRNASATTTYTQRERWLIAYDTMPIGRANGAGTGMERPLPPRTETVKTRGIDLLTPYTG